MVAHSNYSSILAGRFHYCSRCAAAIVWSIRDLVDYFSSKWMKTIWIGRQSINPRWRENDFDFVTIKLGLKLSQIIQYLPLNTFSKDIVFPWNVQRKMIMNYETVSNERRAQNAQLNNRKGLNGSNCCRRLSKEFFQSDFEKSKISSLLLASIGQLIYYYKNTIDLFRNSKQIYMQQHWTESMLGVLFLFGTR